MKFIDPIAIGAKANSSWLLLAQQATEALKEATDEAGRKVLIQTKQALWSELKPVLARLMDGKCWYCETRDIRSDNAVDHYRPKGRVAEDAGHDGYWWLAFDHRNLRFSCTFCNSRRRDREAATSGGKQDHFPLAEGSFRAHTPDDRIEDEVPLLLDPCCFADVALLWFDEAGGISVNPESAFLDDLADEKVQTSSKTYHLGHARLAEARRRVYLQIQALCDRGDGVFPRLRGGDSAVRRIYQRTLEDIARTVDVHAEYSATAWCALRGYRATSPTAELFLNLKNVN